MKPVELKDLPEHGSQREAAYREALQLDLKGLILGVKPSLERGLGQFTRARLGRFNNFRLGPHTGWR